MIAGDSFTPVGIPAILALVGTETFSRGRKYADDGAVLEVVERQFPERGTHLVGVVQGSRHAPYTVDISRTSHGTLATACTCPMTTRCKHVAAVLVTLARRQQSLASDAATSGVMVPLHPETAELSLTGRAVPGGQATTRPSRPTPGRWQRALDVVRWGIDTHPADPAPLALQFDVTGDWQGGYLLEIRPLRRGARGRWIRSGASWSTFEDANGDRLGFASEHVDIMCEILGMTARYDRYRYGSAEPLSITTSGPRLWNVLLDARDAGVALITAGPTAKPVRLVEQAAAPSIDVAESNGDLTISPAIMVGGSPVRLESFQLLGNPAHSIAWWTGGDANSGGVEDLYLARLGRPLPTGFRYLLGDPHPLVVPAADRQRFLGTYYPSLRRSVELTSRDGSFAFPAPTIRLALKVDHQPGPWAGIRWEWHEQVGGAVTRAPLWDRTTTADADAAARRAILDRVHETTVAISSLHDHDTAPPARVWPTTIAVPSKTTGDGHAIDDGASQPTPERPARLAATATLTGMEAVDFVTRVLPALEAIDGVDVDEVDVRPSFREALAPATIALDGAPEESRDWFDLNVSVQVDNEEVPFHELFTALAQGEQHLILPSGTYFRIDRPEFEQLRALIAEAATLTDEPSQRVRVSRYQASLWEEFEGLAVLSAQARAWGRSIARLRSLESVEEVPVPTRLQATLRPYQERGYHWLNFLRAHGLGGVLADDMGLGKTVQAIALFCRCREGTGRQEPPFLVVAPTSVVGNWVAEVRRFAPDLAVTAIAETQARRNVDLATVCAGMDIVVTSYALFRLEFEKYHALPWSGLVLDEAQQVKNHQSKSHYCATRLEAPFKLAITGTPLENNLMELWSAFSIVAPGLLGDAKHFTTFYQTPIERGGDGERLARLRRRIKPLLARRTKEEVAPDLPEKLEQVIELDLNPQHRRAYDTLLHRERAKVLRLLGDLHRNRFEIFRSLTMLRQASIDPSLTDTRYGRVASTKLEALMERLAEITAEGHRVLVFSQFTRFLGRVRARLEDDGVAHCYLDGRTLRRDEVVRKFKNGEAPVFLISLKAGGLGLNLTEADYCILLDPWWNPAAEAQAVDRAHRIGQDRRVIVYRLVARDTIEEKVMALKARKAALVASVLGGGGGLGDGQLTAEDIRALLE